MKQKYFERNSEEKREIVKKIKAALAEHKDVLFAFLYGSFIEHTGDFPFHDIDVGIYVTDLDKKKAVYYSFDLAEELSGKIKMPVDVRVLNSAPVTFLFHVVRGELLLNRDDDERCKFTEYVVRHYLDMEPLYRRAIQEAYAS